MRLMKDERLTSPSGLACVGIGLLALALGNDEALDFTCGEFQRCQVHF